MMKMSLIMIVTILLSVLFYNTSKSEKKEMMKSTVFECGFSSYFYSRFSFSIHYYMIGLIFLFFDLELCVMMPMMSELDQSVKMKYTLMFFVAMLLMALIVEWKEKKLEWKY